MRRTILLLCALSALAPAAARAQENRCAAFQSDMKALYNFKPSRLTAAERTAKSALMDRFWDKARAKPSEALPCLREALRDPRSDPWFLYDGSNLLVTLDPSPASKVEQIKQYAAVDLGDVDLGWWVPKMAERGREGFDVSEAGAHWLAHPDPSYVQPLHGSHVVNRFEGALYIFGSMDEAQATPALARIAVQPAHPGRNEALALLILQATPESFLALKGLDPARLDVPSRAAREVALRGAQRLTPRAQPKISREEFLKAFTSFVAGDSEPFFKLVEAVPDGELDVVATLKPEDLPLVRQVRRRFAAAATPHGVDYYMSFTQILTTLVWRPELVN